MHETVERFEHCNATSDGAGTATTSLASPRELKPKVLSTIDSTLKPPSPSTRRPRTDYTSVFEQSITSPLVYMTLLPLHITFGVTR